MTKRTVRRQRHSYSPQVADLIWDRLLDDVSLRQICQDPDMPARSTHPFERHGVGQEHPPAPHASANLSAAAADAVCTAG